MSGKTVPVRIANPARKKRRKSRGKKKEISVMAKRRKRAKRKSKTNPRRRRRKLHGAAAASAARKAPRRRRRKSVRSNPRRRRRHAAASNPRRRKHGRRRRRNPAGMPLGFKILMCAGAGTLLGVLSNIAATTFAPGNATMRKGLALASAVGPAFFLSKKHPILATAMATGALDAGFQSELSFQGQLMVSGPVDQAKLQNAKAAAMGALSQSGGQIRGLMNQAQIQAVMSDMGAVMSDMGDPFSSGGGGYTGA